jgi:hypothetical protein
MRYFFIIFLFCFLFNIENLRAKGEEPLSTVDAYINDFSSLGSVRSDIKEAVFDFSVAKACIERDKIDRDYKKDPEFGSKCSTWFNSKEKGRLRARYNTYGEIQSAKLEELEDLVAKKLHEDNYSLAEFAIVAKTILYYKTGSVDEDDEGVKTLRVKKPRIKTAVFYDSDDKNNIVERLLNVKNELSSLRVQKTKKLIELTREVDKEQSKKHSNFRTLMNDRVTKGELYCSNILHFAVLDNSYELVDFIIKNYKEVYPNKIDEDAEYDEGGKYDDESYNSVRKYVNQRVYNAFNLIQAQGKYRIANPKAEFGACALMAPKRYDRSKLQERSSLELTFPSFNKKANEESLKIAELLLINGAQYKEDLVKSRNKSRTAQALKKHDTRPEYSSTIFKDFLEVGGLDKYTDVKKRILRVLVEQDKKSSSRKDVEQRYFSLIDQAIKYDNYGWCDYIINELPLVESEKGFRSGSPAYLDSYHGYDKRRKRKGSNLKGQSSSGFGYMVGKIFGKYKHINQITGSKCKGIVQSWGSGKGSSVKQTMLNLLERYLPSDITSWEKENNVPSDPASRQAITRDGKWKNYNDYKVYSILHIAGEIVNEPRRQIDRKIDGTAISAIRDLPKSISDDSVVNFILNAQDAEGETPWSYGLRTYFENYAHNPARKPGIDLLTEWISNVRKK